MIATESLVSWRLWMDKWFYPLLILGIVVNISSLFIPILEPDGALYASIAKQMAISGDWINLRVEGEDWLDKPHFPFWMTALSFKIFGVHTFSHKLPAILFWAIGAGYTYRFACLLYNKETAAMSVLIYISAAHLVISNNDVRAEPYLTGLIIASVYHLYRASTSAVNFHILAGSLATAMAMMTKGPFVIIIIGSGLFVEWVMKKEWGKIFQLRWIIALLLISLFILPELYCLYVQFDAHPEKKIFDQYGVSGVRFFFWDSQFGRFFNNGPIKGSGDIFFYFHTMLWAFLPWSLLLYASIARRIKNFGHQPGIKTEYITIGTMAITFLLFSLSRFQLPHYMNIIFPLFAIHLAQYLTNSKSKTSIQLIKNTQYFISIVLATLVAFLIYFYHSSYWILALILFIPTLWATLWLSKKMSYGKYFGITFITACFAYLFLHVFFYPGLLQYQSGSEAAFYINQNKQGQQIAAYETSSYSFDFYTKYSLQYLDKNTLDAAVNHGPVVIFTTRENLDSLQALKYDIKLLKAFPHFRISRLNGKFLNYTTRNKVTSSFVLAEIKANRVKRDNTPPTISDGGYQHLASAEKKTARHFSWVNFCSFLMQP